MLRRYKGILPTIDPTAFVDASAQVIGDVHVGAESSIWMNVVVRGDVNSIRIGRRSNVQDGTIVHVMRETHPTTIRDEVTIGHGAIVHGCTIEENCLIGMGATVLNGARIGPNSLVGANALVTEGKSFPENSLIVGAPAKAIRTMSPEQVERLRATAAGYVRNHRRFAAGLKEVASA